MIAKVDGREVDAGTLFGALLDSFPDMIHSVNEQGDIVYCNRMASTLLGYPAAELAGMNIRRLYAPEVLDAVEKGFREIKRTGEKRVESLFVARDGTRIPVEIRSFAIYDDQGAFVRTFSISRDIRALKEMQESLIHAGRLAAIGELASGVAHDINNPLAAVLLAGNVLRRLMSNASLSAEELHREVGEICDTIDESANVMSNITSRLRDFARGVKEQHAPVDLFDPLNDALFILGHRLTANRIKVHCPVVQTRHWVFGDRNQIEQVFLNLMANACDAMAGRDTRELTVTVEPARQGDADCWDCCIRDTGAGIPADQHAKVFKAFHTTKPRGQGTGLGLSIAQSIIREHGGAILLASEVNVGTTFTVRLPARAPA